MGDAWRRDQDRIRPVPLSYKQRESGGNFRKGDFASSGKMDSRDESGSTRGKGIVRLRDDRTFSKGREQTCVDGTE